MKAILYRDLGSPDVLRYEDIEKPTPGDHQVLLRVRAAGANPLDWRLMGGVPPLMRMVLGLLKSKITVPGRDVSGEVEAIGRSVTRFKPGDAVFGACRGAFAEYACASESALAAKPERVTFEQAAAVPVAGYTALQGLRDHGRLQWGQTVLVNGAAGGVGTFAVQIAKSFGADVTGVCSTRNVEMVRSIGADRVIDYTHDDFTRGRARYDLLFDCVGNHSVSACRRVLNPHGVCVMVAGPHGDQGTLGFIARCMTAVVSSWFVNRKFVMLLARSSSDDLALIGELIRAGKVTPVIDHRHGLREVPEALRHLAAGHTRGKIVVTVERGDDP